MFLSQPALRNGPFDCTCFIPFLIIFQSNKCTSAWSCPTTKIWNVLKNFNPQLFFSIWCYEEAIFNIQLTRGHFITLVNRKESAFCVSQNGTTYQSSACHIVMMIDEAKCFVAFFSVQAYGECCIFFNCCSRVWLSQRRFISKCWSYIR